MCENTISLRQMAAIIATFWSCLAVQAAQFAGGAGTPDDPYRIATAEQLMSIGSASHRLREHFILVNDIDLDPNLPGGRVFEQAVIAADEYSRPSFFEGGLVPTRLQHRSFRYPMVKFSHPSLLRYV